MVRSQSTPAPQWRGIRVVLVVSCIVCVSLMAEEAGPAEPLASGQAASPSSSQVSNPVKLMAVDSVIQQAIADGNVPGAVLVVGHNGKVIYRKAYGHRSLEPRRELMTLDTIFDLASLT